MKKRYLTTICAAIALFSTSIVCAEDSKFEYSIGTDVVSSYVFRGSTLSTGPSIQPAAEVTYGDFAFGAWGNAGVSDSKVNELDLYLNYSIAGFSIGATHFYYFDGVYNDGKASFFGDGTQTEVMLSYTISEELPLSLSWYTMVGGGETIGENDGTTASTYIELGYSHSLPHDLNLSYVVGVNPWTDEYGTGFRVPNISARLDYEITLNDACSMNAFLQPVYNTITDDFNCVLGCGFWF